MKPSARIWAVALLLGLGHVSSQELEGSQRPKDVWEVKKWGGLGGLPPFGDADTEQDTDMSIVSKAQSVMPDPPAGNSLLPNPCTDADFLRPNYTLSGLNLTRTFLNASSEFPALYQANVSVHDTANNLPMRCSGEFLAIYQNQQLRIDCAHESGLRDSRFQGSALLNLRLSIFETQEAAILGQKSFQLEQYWVCPPEPVYPRVYRAVVFTSLHATCPPLREVRNATSSCRIAVNMAPFFQPSFTLKGPQEPPEPLVQRPLGPPTPEERPNPPAPDCADVSFTHPNWILEDVVYVPNFPRTVNITQTFNFTITSRATGVTQRCYWGWDNLKTDYLWYGIKPACQPLPGAPPDPSRTVFEMTLWEGKEYDLRIRQNWICGDKEGTFSRKFQAGVSHNLPLFCADNNGRVCTANRHTVKGELYQPVSLIPQPIPPPPGANRPGCTSTSVPPNWSITKFRYDEIRSRGGYPADPWSAPSRAIQFAVDNPAINFTQECRITIPSTANLTTDWFRCYSDPGLIQHPIQTYVHLNPATGEISLNQTWYCADTDPSSPLRFSATGTTWSDYCGETNTTLPVCGTKKIIDTGSCPADPVCCSYYNTRWCAIGLYNSLSPGAEVIPSYARSVPGGITRTERVDPHLLTDPDPNPDMWSCTADSLGKPVAWTLSSNHLEGNWRFTAGALFHVMWGESDADAEGASFYLNMRLANSALGGAGGGGKVVTFGADGWSTMVPWLPGWNPATRYGFVEDRDERWRTSIIQHPRPFRNAVDWEVRFDAAKGYMEVSHSWFCNDKNASAPILFNGTWSGYLNMSCSWNDQRQSIACGLLPEWTNNSITVTPKVTWARLNDMKGLPGNITYPY